MDEDLPEGEYADIDTEESDVVDTDDGGAIVTMDDEEEDTPGESDFYANLAEDMREGEMSTISSLFLDLISKDKEARKKRDQQYEEGIRRTGLGDDAPGGATFEGASKIVHPMLTEACVDFAARAMKELFPPEGPAKSFIPGKVTEEKQAKAKRKTTLLNWQLTVQCPEVRAELEQAMTQVPLAGVQYIKFGWDEPHNRPTVLYVSLDDMYLPYAATNFYSAQRRTHVQFITALDYQQRVKSGMYRDVDLALAGMEPELSGPAKANDKIEGRDQTSYNEDGLRTVYEVYAIAEIEEGEDASPYIISIDKSSGKVLAIYRNWDEEDDTHEEMQWFTELPFIPWRGAYPIGLTHMIGGLSAAATGALRALMDSAHIQNTPSGLKLKGAQIGGQSASPMPGQISEVEGGPLVDDIRKLFMPMPYNPPSAVLFQLLGFVIDAAKGVVRTSLEDISGGNPNAPVGTTLANIEQGSVVYSSIHARLHDAMARMLRILSRLNGMYLDDEQLEQDSGEELASRKDFDGPMDVVPVSDPNIFSEAQRFAQVQAIAQRAAALPQLYDARKVEERVLQTLKIPNPEELLAPPLTPKEQNAISENVAASLGQPILAFPEQDHLAHLRTHLDFMMSGIFGANPLIAPTFLAQIINHLRDHMVLWYATAAHDAASKAMGEDLGNFMKTLGKDTDERRAVDQMLATAGATALSEGEELFGKLPPIIQQAQQMMQQFAPPPMQDPNVALGQQQLQLQSQQAQQRAAADQQSMQLKGQQMQQKAALDQQSLQLKGQQMQQDAQQNAQQAQESAAELQARIAIAAQAEQGDNVRKNAEIQARVAMNAQDNETAMQLAAAEIASGENFAVSTGTGINPNP
jgi:hypothetical protein